MITNQTKILIVPGYLLYPYETGAGVAQFHFIDGIKDKVDLTVLLSPINVSLENLPALKERWPNVGFLHWERKVDVPVAPSFPQRLIGKIKRTIQPQQKEIEVERSEKYKEIHYNIENILLDPPNWMVKSLDEILTREKFDLVQFDLPINMGLAEVVKRRAKTLFVHHEIKFQRIKTSISGQESDLAALQELQGQVAQAECAKLNSFDAIQVFHSEDAEILKSKITTPIFICPFSIDNKVFRQHELNEKVQRLIFVGSDEHLPNLDGLKWLVDQVDKQEPFTVNLHVIGRWSSENRELLQRDWLSFEGFVKDLSPWYRNSVMLAPIRMGAGLRTKIMEAMAASNPVITTKFAAQGIDQDNSGLLFAESLTEIQQHLDQLINEKQAFSAGQSAVYRYAMGNFSSESVIDKRIEIIDKTLTIDD